MPAKADSNYSARAPITEPRSIQDIFCSELVGIDRIGPCVRLTFAVLQHSRYAGETTSERAVIAKLVLPIEAADALVAQIGMSSAGATIEDVRPISAAVN